MLSGLVVSTCVFALACGVAIGRRCRPPFNLTLSLTLTLTLTLTLALTLTLTLTLHPNPNPVPVPLLLPLLRPLLLPLLRPLLLASCRPPSNRAMQLDRSRALTPPTFSGEPPSGADSS